MTLLCSSKITHKKSEGFSRQNLGWTLGCRAIASGGAQNTAALNHTSNCGLMGLCIRINKVIGHSEPQRISASITDASRLARRVDLRDIRRQMQIGTNQHQLLTGEGVEQWKSILIFTLINACPTLEPEGRRVRWRPIIRQHQFCVNSSAEWLSWSMFAASMERDAANAARAA